MTLHLSKISSDALAEVQGPISVSSNKSGSIYARFGKRLLDLTLVLMAAPIVVPLIALVALMILATGAMPFYSQARVGRGGTPFRMWKLRTMVTDADQRLEDYLDENPCARAEWDATQKLKDDPRVTPFGRILRKSSIDELPQLFNVLSGTMSLVGPRPMMMHQRALYTGRAYFELRPGITGFWQVSDRNECAFQDRVLFDNSYLQKVSLKTDAQILIRTIGVVYRATGH